MKGIQMSKLFEPIRIGAIDLSHRVVLAPLTQMRICPAMCPTI
jgi:2,4-dienoyl-CoA reductase-like NADH-dependent reductase (Old Yellow Enzyme family)